MEKKKVNLDELEEGKQYQILTTGIVFVSAEKPTNHKNKLYKFGDAENYDTFDLYSHEIDTIWEVEVT